MGSHKRHPKSGSSTAAPPPKKGDRTTDHDRTTRHGPSARQAPNSQQSPNAQQVATAEQPPTAEQDHLRLVFGGGGPATGPSLTIGGDGFHLGPRANERGTVAILNALQHNGGTPAVAIGGEGGGADLQSLMTLLKDRKNADIQFGNGGSATTGLNTVTTPRTTMRLPLHLLWH